MFKADLKPDTLYRRCHGFSLVELMVALVITLILLAGIGQIYLSSKKSFTIQDTLGHQQENARYAVETIAQDLRRVSYWGGNADIGLILGTLGMVNDDGNCSTSDTTWGRMLDRPIYGKNNPIRHPQHPAMTASLTATTWTVTSWWFATRHPGRLAVRQRLTLRMTASTCVHR